MSPLCLDELVSLCHHTVTTVRSSFSSSVLCTLILTTTQIRLPAWCFSRVIFHSSSSCYGNPIRFPRRSVSSTCREVMSRSSILSRAWFVHWILSVCSAVACARSTTFRISSGKGITFDFLPFMPCPLGLMTYHYDRYILLSRVPCSLLHVQLPPPLQAHHPVQAPPRAGRSTPLGSLRLLGP